MMPEPAPLVSVIMAVYNGEAYLQEAIDSILAQTYTNFELIIINDASTDATPSILAAYDDARIRIIRNTQNLGLACSLNVGLDAAYGTYIARLDADDIALPQRLQKQVAFMACHPNVALSGGYALKIDTNGKVIGHMPCPVADAAIRWTAFFGNPLIHSAVIIRREVLKKHQLRYNPDFSVTEDYDLWCRLLKHGYHTANIPDYLIKYRVHGTCISTTKASLQRQQAENIAYRFLYETMTQEISLERLNAVRYLLRNPKMLAATDVPQAIHDLTTMETAFKNAFSDTYHDITPKLALQKLRASIIHRRWIPLDILAIMRGAFQRIPQHIKPLFYR